MFQLLIFPDSLVVSPKVSQVCSTAYVVMAEGTVYRNSNPHSQLGMGLGGPLGGFISDQ
jgi:hypothetical protein